MTLPKCWGISPDPISPIFFPLVSRQQRGLSHYYRKPAGLPLLFMFYRQDLFPLLPSPRGIKATQEKWAPSAHYLLSSSSSWKNKRDACLLLICFRAHSEAKGGYCAEHAPLRLTGSWQGKQRKNFTQEDTAG